MGKGIRKILRQTATSAQTATTFLRDENRRLPISWRAWPVQGIRSTAASTAELISSTTITQHEGDHQRYRCRSPAATGPAGSSAGQGAVLAEGVLVGSGSQAGHRVKAFRRSGQSCL